MLTRIAIAANEAISEIVKRRPELADAGDGSVRASERIKGKVPAADRDGLRRRAPVGFAGDYVTAAETVGDVNAVVEGKGWMIGPQLRVLFGKAGEPCLLDVGLAVPVRVLHPDDATGKRDDDAAAPGLDAGREQELIAKVVRGFKIPVAVAVLEQPH